MEQLAVGSTVLLVRSEGRTYPDYGPEAEGLPTGIYTVLGSDDERVLRPALQPRLPEMRRFGRPLGTKRKILGLPAGAYGIIGPATGGKSLLASVIARCAPAEVVTTGEPAGGTQPHPAVMPSYLNALADRAAIVIDSLRYYLITSTGALTEGGMPLHLNLLLTTLDHWALHKQALIFLTINPMSGRALEPLVDFASGSLSGVFSLSGVATVSSGDKRLSMTSAVRPARVNETIVVDVPRAELPRYEIYE